MTQTEMTTHARDMVRAVDIPVIADADTGHGGPTNITRTIIESLLTLREEGTPAR